MIILFSCFFYLLLTELNLGILHLDSAYLAKIILTCLTFWIAPALFRCNFSPYYRELYFLLVKSILIVLAGAFIVRRFFFFFFLFELSIIPILGLIIGWGTQPERLKAGLYIFYYTLFGSLPLLIITIFLFQTGFTRVFSIIRSLRPFEFIEIWILSGAFLIKMPFYLGHIWLPKAHVEAPLVGSIVLARLILKLGGLGLIWLILIPLVQRFLLNLIICVSVFGGAIISFVTVRLVDIKLIVAYSSVVHISLVIAGRFLFSPIGLSALLIIIICHGLTSPGIFLGVTIIYNWSHTRRTVLNKGILGVNSTFSSIWFSLIVLNFGGPFTLNLLSEALLIRVVISSSIFNVLYLSLIRFFSLLYNLILYSSLNQGVSLFSPWINKVCLKEIILMLSLVLPCLLLLGVQF